MGKRTFYKKPVYLLATFLILILPTIVSGQIDTFFVGSIDPTDSANTKGHEYSCGANASYFASLAIDSSGSVGGSGQYGLLPDEFPSSAIITCGHFDLYFEDLVIGNGGFAEGGGLTGTLGIQRRNTLCAVLSYIESTFDLSALGSQRIRIHVDTSYSAAIHPAIGLGFFARAGAHFYSQTPPYITSGFVHDFITTGVDPTNSTNEYHATLQVNFHQVVDILNGHLPVVYLNDYTAQLNNCDLDLYSILVHELGHILGWFSLVRYNPVANQPQFGQAALTPQIQGINLFTGLDYSMYSKQGTTWEKLITGTLTTPQINSLLVNAPQFNNIWLNNLGASSNHPVFSGSYSSLGWQGDVVPYQSYGSHIDEQWATYTIRGRESPGEREDYVMAPFGKKGVLRRTFTKGELRTFQTLGNGNTGYGYDLNSTFISNNTVLLNNNKPYSTKMGITYTNYPSFHFLETVQHDHQMQNNTGVTYTYDLTQDATLTDLDNDDIKVYPGSLFNIRGCGTGNVTTQCSIINNGQGIVFTPKPNFVGRAQFGFNLWDGKEKGAFVIYTIDVTTGTAITYTPGGEMIFNGDFEQGTEVKIVGNELLPNSSGEHNLYEGKVNYGAHFADCHPYSYMSNLISNGAGIAIKNSYILCNNATQTKHTSGIYSNAFPGLWSWNYPNSDPSNGHDRYVVFYAGCYGGCAGTFFRPKASFENCKRYKIEYDIYSPFSSTISLRVGFGSMNTITWPAGNSYFPVLNYSTFSNASVTPGAWQHITQYFWYCGDPSDVIHIFNYTSGAGDGFSNRVYFDNLSIAEDLNPPATAVSVSQSSIGSCSVELTANVTNGKCDTAYQWQLNGVNITGATQQTFTAPSSGGVYSVVVTDPCGSVTGTTTVTASCDPCAYFGTTSPNLLSGTISSNITGGGPYYMNSGITISGNVTISNAVIFIGGMHTITVDPNAKLTLDNCHLFGCSDMWRGITLLTNSGGNTGVLDIRNNTLIEDADDAVYISGPGVPNTGTFILRSDMTTFNRNKNGIVIAGAQSQNVNDHYKISNTIISGRDYSVFPGYPSDWPEVTDLKAAYTGQFYEAPYNIITFNTAPCKNGQVEETGIQLTSVGPTVSNVYYELQLGASGGTTEMNIFDNLRYGISADRSNFASVNNTFIQMTSPDATGGDGIFATAPITNNNFRARIYEPDATITTGNSFYGFYRGVEIVGYREVLGSKSLMITSNANASVGLYGYKFLSRNYESVKIDDNQIYNLQNGIYVAADVTPLHMGAINVDRNKLGSVSNGNDPMFMKYGIVIERITGGPSGMTGPTTSGKIYAERNELSHVKYGIKIANHNQESSVSYNTISLDNNNDPLQYGVKHQGSNNAWTFNNRITGPGSENGLLKGIETRSSSRNYVNCNTVTDCPFGIEFSGGTMVNMQWHGNTMINNKQGFRLDKAAISDQKGLDWACENNWQAINGFSYTNDNYQTFVQNTSPNPIPAWRPDKSKLNVTSGTNYNPTANFADPSLPINTYSIGNGLATTNMIGLEACPVKVKSTGTSQMLSVMMNLEDYGQFTGTVNFITQYDLWLAARTRDTMMPDTAGLLREFVNLGYNGRFYQLAYIDSLFGEEDTTSIRSIISTGTILNPLYDTSANGLVIADDTAANRVIENYLKLYDLYIKYIGGYMDSADTARVDSIASLCVLYDGYGVYQARSFHNILHEDDLREFADICDTAQSGVGQGRYAQEGGSIMPFELKQTSAVQSYSLLPNPNNGNFIVKQLVADDRPVNAEVWNAVGAKVYAGKLVFSGKQAAINLGGMASGGYLLKLYDSKGQHYTIKFIVIE